MTQLYFNPGCALSIYKPEAENKILEFLNTNYDKVELHKICCKHDPQLDSGSLIINVCAGCDKRFRTLYENVSTISLWEILDELDGYPYPDYHGLTLSIHDACDVRTKPEVHTAVRNLLKKMNINVMETKFSGTKSICCGDNFYPTLPIDKVHEKMKKRADSMPCNEVCVYCVSCIKAMYIGGKAPRHLIDLLLGEATEPQIYDTILWHEELQDYIDMH